MRVRFAPKGRPERLHRHVGGHAYLERPWERLRRLRVELSKRAHQLAQRKRPVERRHSIAFPPFTRTVSPVMNDDEGEARNDTAPATSVGSANRRNGVCCATMSRAFSGMSPTSAVSVIPGATLFTRMPEGPSSTASARVNVARADFATA